MYQHLKLAANLFINKKFGVIGLNFSLKRKSFAKLNWIFHLPSNWYIRFHWRRICVKFKILIKFLLYSINNWGVKPETDSFIETMLELW